uniref:PI3K/PI4K domain-containing protein n=1 Tax=Hydatigena taeniaeformis TaxID=6205 RepID=A0A0R3WWC2_HYDTA
LVKHHAAQLDGFLTLARFPLDRPAGESPLVLQGVRSDELEEKLRLKAMEMGLKLCHVLSINLLV